MIKGMRAGWARAAAHGSSPPRPDRGIPCPRQSRMKADLGGHPDPRFQRRAVVSSTAHMRAISLIDILQEDVFY